jgi:Tfp pilus assembly protein PilF
MGRHGATRGILWLAAALTVASGLALYGFLSRRSPPVPHAMPLAYDGPFKNVDPAVQYVADDRCAECHEDKARTYAQHPMGRSILPMTPAALPPIDPAHHNPFDTLGSRFLVEPAGARVKQLRQRLDAAGQPVAALEWSVDYVIGSGAKGYSYLADRDGYLFQTPLSWYAHKQRWDLSPTFGTSWLTGRPVMPECLFCHANRALYQEGSVNHYARPVFDGHAIGCQRCHGPGELHVASRERRDPIPGSEDFTIVNPRHLDRPLREAVCEQCHLEGEVRVPRHGRGLYDFRPGVPLEAFWSVFVQSGETGEGQKAVGHVEQMYQSRCFRGGALGCISCHDPHERVGAAQRVDYYRKRCLQCHGQQGCSLPLADRLARSPRDSCIECHMPPYGAADIPHTASTDHRILRTGRPSPPRGTLPEARENMPIVSFYRGRPGTDEREDERDLALALVKLAVSSRVGPFRQVPPALEAASRRDDRDLAAREAIGHVLALQERRAEALAAYEAVLATAPNRETALDGAATMAELLGKTETALVYWRRAVAANPWMPDYRRGLVLLLVKRESWDEARPECQAWVRLDPISTEARSNWVLCLLAAGQKDEARAEFARIEAMAPNNLVELRARFRKKLQ